MRSLMNWMWSIALAVTALASPAAIHAECENVIPPGGKASIYPWVRNVSGLQGTITKVEVLLTDMNHTYPDDINMLLVGPQGQTCVLMCTVGGEFDLRHHAIRLRDDASDFMPGLLPLSLNDYRPTNSGSALGTMPAPAPPAPYTYTLDVFNGTNPNGDWKLFIEDFIAPDGGCIGDWALAITTTGGGGPCTYTIESPTIVSPGSGTSGFINMTTDDTCTWSMTGGSLWAVPEPVEEYTGSGSAFINVYAATNVSRVTTFRVGGQQGAVMQLAQPGFYLTTSRSDFTTETGVAPGGSTTGWSNLAYDTPGLAQPGFAAGAFTMRNFAHPTKQRVSGVFQNRELWLPFSSLGSSSVVRGKFFVHGDASTGTDLNLMPNVRVRMSARFAQNAMQEVFHHTGDVPSQTAIENELRPSNVVTSPSLYRVDLWPVWVPSLTSPSTEGAQAGAEAFSQLPQDDGTIYLTEFVVGKYPKVWLQAANVPARSYSNAPFGDLTMLRYNASEADTYNLIAGLGTGDPATSDVLALPGQLPTVAESAAGVTLGTLNVPSNRIGVAIRNFNPANGGSNFSNRLRAEQEELYRMQWTMTSTQGANRQSQVRLRARSLKFAWSMKFELGGAWAAGTQSNLIAQQSMPSTGTLNMEYPGANPATSSFYNLLMSSPITSDIRSNFPQGTALSTRMPNILAQPGSGANSASRRDIFVGFDILDSTSGGVNAGLEQGQARASQIVITTFPQVGD